MRIAVTLAVGALAGCTTSTVDLSRSAAPIDQASWAGLVARDYPSRALRDGAQGNVGVNVTVSAEGIVSDCDVTRTSGSADLDEAACRNVTRYARFEPALNTSGEPSVGNWSTTIVYRMP